MTIRRMLALIETTLYSSMGSFIVVVVNTFDSFDRLFGINATIRI